MFAGVARNAERAAKRRLSELFPSFREHVRRMRIRYPFELGDIVKKERRVDVDSRNLYDAIRSIEEYAAYSGKNGMYDFGRTIYIRYIPRPLREPAFHSGYIHEFVHYLTEALAREAFGRAIHIRGHERYIPLDVWEGIAVAFQHHYLEEYEGFRLDPIERKLIVADHAEKYARDYQHEGEFDKQRFARTYFIAREYLMKHGMNEAAKRIPEIIRRVLRIRPRNVSSTV